MHKTDEYMHKYTIYAMIGTRGKEPCQYLFILKGLGNIIICTDGQPQYFVGFF